jgi:hypothetical protein
LVGGLYCGGSATPFLGDIFIVKRFSIVLVLPGTQDDYRRKRETWSGERERLRVEKDANGGRDAKLFSCFQLICPSKESVLCSKSSF